MVNSFIVFVSAGTAIQTFHASSNTNLFWIHFLLWINFTDFVEFVTPKHPILNHDGATHSRWH